MEFLGVGYQEVLVVLVLMLVVVGPQRMPEVAYQIGRAVREMQKYARAVRDEFSEEWEYLDSQAKEIRGEMDSAGRDLAEVRRSLRSETDQIDKELKDATDSVQEALPADKSTAGRTPSPLPGARTSDKKPQPTAMVSTNSGPAKPIQFKPKENAVQAPKPAQAAAKDKAIPAPEETSAPAAPKPPLVF